MKNIKTFICLFYLIASLHLISFSNQVQTKLKKNVISKKITDDQDTQQIEQQIDNLIKQRDYLEDKLKEIKSSKNSEDITLSDEELAKLISNLKETINALNNSIEDTQNELEKINEQREHLQQDPKQHTFSSFTKSSENTGKSFIQLKQSGSSSSSSKNEAATYASACLQGALSAIPGSFCYKKGADAGTIPTGCPDGYFRSAALCYQNCRSGYTFVLGVCWEKCRSGYTDMGLTCFKWNWFKSKSYGKDSYMSSSITNFSDRIPCPTDMYKSGALCYRDCAKAGLVNCGIGACASSSESCGAGIGMMALEFALGAIQLVSLVVTFGASSGATGGFTAAKKAFSKISKTALKDTMKTVARIAAKSLVKERLKQAAITAAKNALKESIKIVSETVVSTVCEQVTNQILATANNSVPDSLDLASLDPTGIASAVEKCSGINTENDKLNCAKSVLNAVSTVDVTGLTAMAGALIQEICPWV